MHEYTVINHPRHTVLFFLAIISLAFTSFITVLLENLFVFILPTFLISFSISNFAVFGFLYWLFNNFLWKTTFFSKHMNFPDISGEWYCSGLSNNIVLKKEFDWKSEITITQKWDKILIISKTSNSKSYSKSVVGGINYVEGKGYEVSYHYHNTPNVSEVDLKKHEGFCVLCFAEDLETAEGYYFNNVKERASYGEMNLRVGENT